MDALTKMPKQLKLAGAMLAIAALVIGLIAVAGIGGPVQAQRGGGDPTPTPLPTPTPAPQLCGPGQDHFPQKPDEVVSKGHYALFDAYWQSTDSTSTNSTSTGTLNDNLCPPAATHKDVTTGGVTKEVTTRFNANIDVRTTIIQVKDKHKVDVVATNAAASTTKLSLEKYGEVRPALGLGPKAAVPDGTKVWWLRLEDSALGTDPSDLVMGFSTGLLDDDHWQNPEIDGEGNHLPAFEYEMESVRVIGPSPSDLPHVLTYWEPDLWKKSNKAEVVWNGLDTDVNSMPMEAGEYEHLEWVFTKPGTYIVQVHLKGHVRQSKPSGWDDNPLNGPWKPLTPDKTVTSEVKRFVFQVGDLHINAQPHFGYHATVYRLARYNTKVGSPIPVFGSDHDQMEYSLEGAGSDNFKLVPTSLPFVGNAVQLVVAPYGDIARKFVSGPKHLDLRLRVTDKHDHEDNADNVLDDVVPIRITITADTDEPWVSLTFQNENPRAGDTVKIKAQVWNGGDDWYYHEYRLYALGADGTKTLLAQHRTPDNTYEFTTTRATAGQVVYLVEAHHGEAGPVFRSLQYPVVWRH